MKKRKITEISGQDPYFWNQRSQQKHKVEILADDAVIPDKIGADDQPARNPIPGVKLPGKIQFSKTVSQNQGGFEGGISTE